MKNISDVRIYHVKNGGTLLAYASINLDGTIIKGFLIRRSKGNIFITMPSKKEEREGKVSWLELFTPPDHEREQIVEAIRKKYEETLELEREG